MVTRLLSAELVDEGVAVGDVSLNPEEVLVLALAWDDDELEGVKIVKPAV